MDNLYINDQGHKFWYNKKEQLHREGNSAVEYTNGNKYWWIHGELHRVDGPAIEYHDGNKYWYYHGEQIKCSTQEEFERIIKLRIFW